MLKLSSSSFSVDALGDTRVKKGIQPTTGQATLKRWGYDVKPARLEGAGCDGCGTADHQHVTKDSVVPRRFATTVLDCGRRATRVTRQNKTAFPIATNIL
jgi:hypothetical protein